MRRGLLAERLFHDAEALQVRVLPFSGLGCFAVLWCVGASAPSGMRCQRTWSRGGGPVVFSFVPVHAVMHLPQFILPPMNVHKHIHKHGTVPHDKWSPLLVSLVLYSWAQRPGMRGMPFLGCRKRVNSTTPHQSHVFPGLIQWRGSAAHNTSCK